MDESACLLKSFSYPSDASFEDTEGDSARALGQSISFGRFCLESLAWEKWSTFSHDYREEAEKVSRPGSVAQKKAYFEAHYKQLAAKKAASLLAEANAAVNNTHEGESTDEVHNNSVDLEQVKSSSIQVVSIEQGNKDAIDSSPDFSAVENVYIFNHENHRDSFKLEELDITEKNIHVDLSTLVTNSDEPIFIHQNHDIVVTQEKKTPDKEVDHDILSSGSKKGQPSSSSRLQTLGRASKFHPLPDKQASSIPSRNVNNATTRSKKPAEYSTSMKRITTKSLPLSTHFSSRSGETHKTSPVFQPANPRNHTRPCRSSKGSSVSNVNRMSKDSSTSLQNPARASLHELPKRPPVTSQLDDKRSRSVSSSANGIKTRSSIATCPFSFKSDERAERRKEKVKEEISSREAEKVLQRERSKIPLTQAHSPKLGRKSTTKDTSPHLPRMPPVNSDKSKHDTGRSNHIRMHSVTSLPKLTGPQPPRRPSSNTATSMRIVEKDKQITRCSVTSLPKKDKQMARCSVTSLREKDKQTARCSVTSVLKKDKQTTRCSVTSLRQKNTRENASPNLQR